MASAAVALKRLRQRASPPLTIRGMAEMLGVPASSYARYEDPADFKKPYLPVPLAQKVGAVLADFGVDPDEVMALAGIGTDQGPGVELSASEEQLLERWRALSLSQRRLIQGMMDELTGQGSKDAPSRRVSAVHSPTSSYQPEGS